MNVDGIVEPSHPSLLSHEYSVIIVTVLTVCQMGETTPPQLIYNLVSDKGETQKKISFHLPFVLIIYFSRGFTGFTTATK
jgi:hypothetical protein